MDGRPRVKPGRRAFIPRRLEDDDVAGVVALHQRAFPDSVLTRLGTEALVRYYGWQLHGGHDVAGVVVMDGDRLVGFLVGGRFRGSMIGFVKRHRGFLALHVARHPSLLVRRRGRTAIGCGLRLLSRRSQRLVPERPERVPEASFGILAVAVDPDRVRRGVGTTLLKGAERVARAGGYQRMHLTLDPGNNDALAFYRGLGWQRLHLPGDSPFAWLMGRELNHHGNREGHSARRSPRGFTTGGT